MDPMARPPLLPPRGSLRDWRRKFKTAVKGQFLVRFHMAIILGVVTVVGMLANKLLFVAGVPTMALRYPAAVAISYLAFFVGVWIWIGYVQSAAPQSLLDPRLAAPMVAAALTAAPALSARQQRQPQTRLDHEDLADGVDGAVDGLESIGDAAGLVDEGVVWVLVLLLVAGVVLAGGWLVWQAPAILSEAAFSATLAGAVRKALRDEVGPHWAWHVFRKSVIPFALVVLVAAGAGWGARVVCPQAHTIKAALSCDAAAAELLSE